MPHLQREAEELLKQAVKIAGHYDHEGQPAVHQKRRSRNSAHVDNVILSSKFVVEAIRDRLEDEDPDVRTFLMEFPRSDADALEKRGVEILADPDERPPRKKIAIVKVAESASISRPPSPKKRGAKGSKQPIRESSPVSGPSSPTYHLNAKDFEWMEVYNLFCAEKKWPKIDAKDLEAMLTSLDVKKNELILAHLKSEISATNKTTEGTAKRHEKDYFLLQKFIAYTPNTFDQLDHLNLGRSFNITTQTAFDIWEYWKLKLQDSFYQPLIFPPASVFDYRRISMLAAWNMTTVNYAQRLRHDAERIRLMYDLLQKRNHATIKVMAKEEDLTVDLVELCLHPETKSLSPDLLHIVMHYMQELSPHTKPDPAHPHAIDPCLDPLRGWIESVIGAPRLDEPVPSVAPPAALLSSDIHPKQSLKGPQNNVKPVICPPLDTEPSPNIPEEKKFPKKKIRQQKIRLLTRGRVDVTFEHADNSCCENGPMDDEEMIRQPRGGGHKEAITEEEEPLYMINNDPSVLKEIYPSPSKFKPTEFRSRLRSWKRTG